METRGPEQPLRQAQDRPLHEYLRAHARRQPDKAAYLWYGHPVTHAEPADELIAAPRERRLLKELP